MALLAIAAIWSGALIWGWRRRARLLGRVEAVLAPLVVAGATFFVIPPVHTTNPRVLTTIVHEIVSGGDGATPSPLLEVAAFHFLVVLIKPGLVIGAGLWLSLVPALRRSITSPVHRLLLIAIASYSAFLLTLPWAQTRYMMPVVAMLTLLLADAFCRGWARRPLAAGCFAVAAIATLGADLVRSYPDLNLNGYQWVGERSLAGRWSLGYRGIVQTPSDGLEQALAWTAENTGDGDRVLTYALPRQIVRWLAPDPGYEWIDGIAEPEGLSRADFVVTTINADLPERSGQQPLYDRRLLERDFVRVYSLTRAYDIEVASVWRRK